MYVHAHIHPKARSRQKAQPKSQGGNSQSQPASKAKPPSLAFLHNSVNWMETGHGSMYTYTTTTTAPDDPKVSDH